MTVDVELTGSLNNKMNAKKTSNLTKTGQKTWPVIYMVYLSITCPIYPFTQAF